MAGATQKTRKENDNALSTESPHHPFSDSIMSEPLPRAFWAPRIPQYDGFTDPEDHLATFNAHMLLYGDTATDPIMCRAFPCTLRNHALRWFFTLPSKSISNFSQLATKFLTHFALSKTLRKTVTSLRNLVQEPHESLQDYISRFNQEAIQIDNLHPNLYMSMIQAGMQPGPFLYSLYARPPLNLEDIWQRASRIMEMEANIEAENKQGGF